LAKYKVEERFEYKCNACGAKWMDGNCDGDPVCMVCGKGDLSVKSKGRKRVPITDGDKTTEPPEAPKDPKPEKKKTTKKKTATKGRRKNAKVPKYVMLYANGEYLEIFDDKRLEIASMGNRDRLLKVEGELVRHVEVSYSLKT